MEKLTWVPRGGLIVLMAELTPGVEEKRIAFQKDGAEETINEETIIDIIDVDGNYYIEDYRYFIYDKGESVKYDLGLGDEVMFNFANLREIERTTDRSLKKTYFIIADSVITMRRPGSKTI